MTAPAVRRATPADAAALVSLRAAMFESFLGEDTTDGAWRERARAWFAGACADPLVYLGVVDGEDGTPVACILVQAWVGPAAPRNPGGVKADLSNVSTHPDHRGRGYAGALLDAALAWADDAGVDVIDLRATDMGRALYERRGFTGQSNAMRRRRPAGVTPGAPSR